MSIMRTIQGLRVRVHASLRSRSIHLVVYGQLALSSGFGAVKRTLVTLPYNTVAQRGTSLKMYN